MVLQAADFKRADLNVHARQTLELALGRERSLLREHIFEVVRRINIAPPEEMRQLTEELQHWTNELMKHVDRLEIG